MCCNPKPERTKFNKLIFIILLEKMNLLRMPFAASYALRAFVRVAVYTTLFSILSCDCYVQYHMVPTLKSAHSVECFSSRRLQQTKQRASHRNSFDASKFLMQTTESFAQDNDDVKMDLINSIRYFKEMQVRDGKVSVDFGVRGGELDSKTRAPRNLAENNGFYATSEAVGLAADQVFTNIQRLETLNPTLKPTQFFGTADGERCPLHGSWKLLFTTAADASFSPNSTRGDAQASNVVYAVHGKITNIIDFLPRQDGKSRSLEQLKVRLVAQAESDSRVSFRFKYVKVKLGRVFGIPLFGKKLTLIIPVPGPFFTRILTLLRRVKETPKAFFEVIYLDQHLRIHKTGEGNIFVQGRPDWIATKM
jgi:hypothetical protein